MVMVIGKYTSSCNKNPRIVKKLFFFFFSICTNVIITVSAKSIKDIGLFYRFKRRRSYREA